MGPWGIPICGTRKGSREFPIRLISCARGSDDVNIKTPPKNLKTEVDDKTAISFTIREKGLVRHAAKRGGPRRILFEERGNEGRQCLDSRESRGESASLGYQIFPECLV